MADRNTRTRLVPPPSPPAATHPLDTVGGRLSANEDAPTWAIASSDAETERAIREQHIVTLYRLMPRLLLFYPLAGLLVVVTLWESGPQPLLTAWFGCLFAVTLLRLLLIIRFWSARRGPAATLRWGRIAVVSTTISGLMLSSSALLFFEPGHLVAVLAITAVIMGATSGALGSLAPHPPSYWGFIIGNIGPLVVSLLITGGWTNLIIAVLSLFMLVNAGITNRTLFLAMDHSLRLSLQNDELRRQAEQASAAKTRFLAAASHDLRQPLHALGLLFAALAAKTQSPETNPLLQRIRAALSSVDLMLTAILHISKLDAGIVKPVINAIDLSALFHRLDREFGSVAAQRGIRLHIRPTGLWVRSDGALLESILRNFIANALRYAGGGRVLVAARARDGTVRCEVHDTGPGIAPEKQQRIFEEFYQLDNPERNRNQGMGLGLAIARRNAALLEHPLTLRSAPGSGSCFAVSAPLAPPPLSEPAQHPADARRPTLDGVTVLLVDDDPLVINAMSSLLEQWGCKVLTADTSANALKVVAAGGQRPALILADYRLTGDLTGTRVINAVRERLGQPIPAAIITGDTAPERLREANQAGFPLLHKPVPPAKLQAALQELVASRPPNA